MTRYAVIGAGGRQGYAAAWDLARFGNTEQIILVDTNYEAARARATALEAQFKNQIFLPAAVDVTDKKCLVEILKINATDSIVAATDYAHNLALTELAIEARVNMVDLGGNTGVLQRQHLFHKDAQKAGVSIIPDCGMGPGLNLNLGVYAAEKLDDAEELLIYCGGLPQYPEPPFNYALLFNIRGLVNEYSGVAEILFDGKMCTAPCFTGFERVDMGGIGTLEAARTSGGLSTAPWTLPGRFKHLKSLEYKTLRYEGHWEAMRAYTTLGLFGTEPIVVGEKEIVPRDILETLLESKIAKHDVRDIGIIHAIAKGRKDGKPAVSTAKLIVRYDEKTNLTAMQQLTGWHASIVAVLSAHGEIPRGVAHVEELNAARMVSEARKRGFVIKEQVVA